MKLAKHRQYHRTASLMALGLIAASLLVVALPEAPQRSDALLTPQSVRAADQMSFLLSEPLVLSQEPRVIVERGTIALAAPEGVAALSANAAQQLLESGQGTLVLQDAELVIGHAPRKHQPAEAEAVPGDAAAIGSLAAEGSIGETRPEAPLAAALVGLKFRNLIIDDGALRFAAFKGAPRLDTVHLKVRPVPGERLSVKGRFALLGRAVDVETTFALANTQQVASNVAIRGTLRSAGVLDSFFSGQFVTGDGGRLIADSSFIEIKDVPVFARWLGLAWPRELGLKQFRADGRLEWAGALVNVPDGRFKLDGNAASGSLLLNGRNARPLIDGTLAFDQFDADQLLARREDQPRETLLATMQTTANWLPASMRNLLTELHLPILRQIDIDLRASAQRTTAGAMQFGRTAAALSLHDGRVVLDFAEMELQSGGRGSLQFSLNTHQPVPRCGVRGKFKGVRVEKLARTILHNEFLVGPADVTFELAGDWKDPDRLLSTLDGKIDLSMASGARLGGDLRALIDLREPEAEPQEGWGAAAQGETFLRRVDATLLFDSGVGRVDRLLAQRTDERQLAVTGYVDVRAKQLDLNVFASETKGSAAPSVLLIDGHWDAPKLQRRSLPDKAENPLYPATNDNGPPDYWRFGASKRG